MKVNAILEEFSHEVTPCSGRKISEEARILAKTAIEILYVPKRLVGREGWPEKGQETVGGKCPVCGAYMLIKSPKYYILKPIHCRDCGQRIDITEE